MTVAAVVLAASPESALADVEGQARVRRIADAAWSGGAMPIVVVSFDTDGAVAASLAGASVTLAEPVPEGAPALQMARGMDVAASLVTDVSAALIWPMRMVWVSPETVTSLIEAHGVDRATVLRPTYDGEPGWPVLVPRAAAAILASMPPGRMPDEIMADFVNSGVPSRDVELGDPGVNHDAGTPRSELPEYLGPSEPAAPHSHEWGAALEDAAEDSPMEGPSLAPYEQAATE